MTALVVLLGAVLGAGISLVVLGSVPMPVRRIGRTAPDGSEPGGRTRGEVTLRGATMQAARRVEKDLHSKSMLIQDAHMVGRTLETHAMHKLVGFVLGAALVAFFGLFIVAVAGLGVPLVLVGALSLAGGLGGWLLPDSILRTEADKERELFQQVTESWLELVAQLVTAGSDTFGALSEAASYSEQPGFVTIRDSLRAAAASGLPPWSGLQKLADERRLRFLDPFCSALELAGTTGAGSRQAILSQVDAARSKALLEADAAAASANEKMGAPLALIGGAFMLLMGYPPLAGILDSSGGSLGGL